MNGGLSKSKKKITLDSSGNSPPPLVDLIHKCFFKKLPLHIIVSHFQKVPAGPQMVPGEGGK